MATAETSNLFLSVVVITFNEEKNIQQCLSSVQGIADEIIVVDSMSVDATQAVAQRFGAKVFRQEWMGYSDTKNYANTLATYNYILSIDADEVVSEELKHAILKEKRLGFRGAYSMNRLSNYCGTWIRHTSWYPDKKIRIFDRRITQWQGDVHERLVFMDKPDIFHLRGDLHHYSYKTIHEHKQRQLKYAKIYAESMLNEGKRFCMLKMIFSPVAKFLKDYIFRLGFIDGRMGYTISKLNAWGTYKKYQLMK